MIDIVTNLVPQCALAPVDHALAEFVDDLDVGDAKVQRLPRRVKEIISARNRSKAAKGLVSTGIHPASPKVLQKHKESRDPSTLLAFE